MAASVCSSRKHLNLTSPSSKEAYPAGLHATDNGTWSYYRDQGHSVQPKKNSTYSPPRALARNCSKRISSKPWRCNQYGRWRRMYSSWQFFLPKLTCWYSFIVFAYSRGHWHIVNPSGILKHVSLHANTWTQTWASGNLKDLLTLHGSLNAVLCSTHNLLREGITWS